MGCLLLLNLPSRVVPETDPPHPASAVTIGIYAYPYLFILLGSLLHFGIRWDESHWICRISTYLCILAYMLAKVFICMFMVERVVGLLSRAPSPLPPPSACLNLSGFFLAP